MKLALCRTSAKLIVGNKLNVIFLQTKELWFTGCELWWLHDCSRVCAILKQKHWCERYGTVWIRFVCWSSCQWGAGTLFRATTEGEHKYFLCVPDWRDLFIFFSFCWGYSHVIFLHLLNNFVPGLKGFERIFFMSFIKYICINFSVQVSFYC